MRLWIKQCVSNILPSRDPTWCALPIDYMGGWFCTNVMLKKIGEEMLSYG